MNTVGGGDTDPGVGGISGWADGAPAGPAVPGAEGAGRRAAEDPLTSPSFSAYRTDSRSYRDSHDGARTHRGEPADADGGGRYGGGHGYQPDPAWNQTSPGTATPSYGGDADGWRGPDRAYPGNWNPAPVPAGDSPAYWQPSHRAPERRETGYESRSSHDPYPGQRDWQATEPDYAGGASRGGADYHAGHERNAGLSGYRDVLAGYGPGDSGYGQPRHGSSGGYGQPGYGSGRTGYRRSKHGLPDTGYDQAAYGSRYQRRDDAADTGYGRPAYGSGPSHGGSGQESGYGDYPGYDGRRG